MLKKGLCLLIGIMMLFCQINVVHATNLASGAESAILIDANSQQVLYHKNETKRLYPASTTKIMTMILLFEAIKEKINGYNAIIIGDIPSHIRNVLLKYCFEKE